MAEEIVKQYISVEEAKAIITAALPASRAERLSLSGATGRIVAEDWLAVEDMPRFSNSAMDGYAVRAAAVQGANPDAPIELPLSGEIAAGGDPNVAWPDGTCLRILTGAPAPDAADGVIPIEETELLEGGEKVRFNADLAKTGNNLRAAGEDMRAGQKLAWSGRRIGAPEIALFAAQGVASLSVAQAPRVAFVATGNELVPVGTPLEPGQIHNSNAPLVAALLADAGYACTDLGVARDEPGALRALLESALEDCDVLITSGGISVGRYDLVGDILVELGAEWHFHKIAQQPGKPLAFMTWRGKPVFCLPGNPVSTLVSTWYYVLPALRGMEGARETEALHGTARLTAPIKGRPSKFFFGRAATRIEGGQWLTEPKPPHGSHILGSLAEANSFILLPPGTGKLEPGESVEIAFFRGPGDSS